MRRGPSFFRFLLLVIFSAIAQGQEGTLLVLQSNDGQGTATVVLTNAQGEVTVRSTVAFSFRWPLVETTIDPQSRLCYIITFPTGVSGAVLYELKGADGLNVNRQWQPPLLSFFDLQYSLNARTLYGIAVDGRYGRILSKFTLGPSPSNVTATSIAPLPYMWFVNASTFNQQGTQFYGLLNNFPGQPNSTLAQKLALGYFGEEPSTVSFIDLHSTSAVDDILQFIAWSAPTRSLLGLAKTRRGSAVVNISSTTGGFDSLVLLDGYGPGPMVAEMKQPAVRVFVSRPEGGFQLARVHLESKRVEWLAHYDGVVAAATLAAWD